MKVSNGVLLAEPIHQSLLLVRGLLTLINLFTNSNYPPIYDSPEDDDSDNIYNVIITANAWNTSIANDSNTTNLEVNVKVIKDENGVKIQ